jgi:hypothetical protein
MQMKMTEYHVGQSVKVLKRTDTLDKPWTEGTIIGVYNGAVAPGYQVVMFADGDSERDKQND